MSWWQISIITLLVYWVVGVVVYEIKREDEDFAVSWSMGIVFPILYILFYPLRVWKHYKLNIKVYKKYNLSYWEKLIGKGLCNGQKMWVWEIKKYYKDRWEDEE